MKAILLLLLLSRASLASEITFYEALRDLSKPVASDTSHSYVNPQLLICQSLYSANDGKTVLCGDGINPGFGSSSEGNAWPQARAVLESSSRLPGVYQNTRSAVWNKKLNSAANQAKYRVKSLNQALLDFKRLSLDYQNQPLAQAVSQGLKQLKENNFGLSKVKASLETFPVSQNAETTPDYSSAIQDAVNQSARLKTLPNVQKWVDELNAAKKNGDIVQISGHLDAIQKIVKSEVPASVYAGNLKPLEDSYRDWVDPDGLISAKHLEAEGVQLRKSFTTQLKTSPNTVNGQAVRSQMNRALLSLGIRNSPVLQNSEKTQFTWGAVALAVAADQAYQEGAQKFGDELLKRGTETLDFALGLVPIIGSINDFAQIIHGMATGYDYSGNRMQTADYVLRSVGVVVGLLPAGSAAVKIGNQFISESFLDGARMIRNSGSGQALAKVSRNAPEVVETVAEGLGTVLKDSSSSEAILNTRKLIVELEDVGKSANSDDLKKFSSILTDNGISIEDRKSIITSFENIEMTTPNKQYYGRWHNDGEGAEQLGRYFFEDLTMSPTNARQRLSIQPKNQMKYLDIFEISPDTTIARGIAAPLFEHPGGATQVFVLGDLKKSVKFIKRIYPQ